MGLSARPYDTYIKFENINKIITSIRKICASDLKLAKH